jgi:hypothetical protein
MLQLTKTMQEEENNDVDLITKIVQVSFFDDATPNDIRKTSFQQYHI